MVLLFKTLFEVKVLHEYYFTNTIGSTIFSINAQQDRLQFLKEECNSERASINDILQFSFPETDKETYKNYHLKLVATYSGFKIGIRVTQKKLSDGSLVYEPLVKFPAMFTINVLLLKNNNAIDLITNKRISTAVPSSYVFCNNTILSNPQFPFISSSISTVRGAYDYEQGELVDFGSGNLAGYYKDEFGSHWNSFEGSSFANEGDRLLLPLKFQYSFPEGTNITQATFNLNNRSGDTIWSFQTNSDVKMSNCFVDFSGLKDLITAFKTETLQAYIFKLLVLGNDGYSNEHTILFNDSFYTSNLWGLVAVQLKTFNTDFDLFTYDGYLKKMQNAAGEWTDDLIFEIPVKSRFAYWRYSNNKDKKIVINDPVVSLYLSQNNNKLLTKRPVSITQSFFLIKEEGGAGEKYFPNPVPGDLKKDETGRLYYDVLVPESDNFPVGL